MDGINQYQENVNAFRAQSESNYIFACQAAVPLVITPDLLYQLWNNFKQYQYDFEPGITYKISHIAVSDLLLSGLCREVGTEFYEIQKEVRDILLEDLELNLGKKRKNTIVAFLQDYAQQEYRFGHRKNLKDIHLLTAESLLNPVEMEKKIIEKINGADNDADKMNYLLLHQNLLPLGFKSELGELSKSVATKSLSPILIAENNPDAPGVLNIKLPARLRGRVKEKSIEITSPGIYIDETTDTGDVRAAIARVTDCLLYRSPSLDLGNCSLTDDDFKEGSELDRLLRGCTHLETLQLSNWGESEEEIDVKKRNMLTVLPPCLPVLKNLSTFFCGGEPDASWGIKDMSAVSNLVNLSHLDLSYNSIVYIVGLDDLEHLVNLELGGNLIGDFNGLENVSSLQLLALNSNLISKIEGLEHLALKRLDLSDNDISEIDGLEGSSELVRLILNDNLIQHIDGLYQLHALEYLELNNNHITEIKNLTEQPSLKSLMLNNNRLQNLTGLYEVRKLEYLDASHNDITNIEGLQYHRNLQHILLSHNKISDLDNAGYFEGLETMDLSYNEIRDVGVLAHLMTREDIPVRVVLEFSKPKSPLPEIKISDNPIEKPPLEIIAQGNEAILKYLKLAAVLHAGRKEPELDLVVENADNHEWLTISVTGHSIDDSRDSLGVALFKESRFYHQAIELVRNDFSRITLADNWLQAYKEISRQVLPLTVATKIDDGSNIIWALDSVSTDYPWEVLIDIMPDGDPLPLVIRSGMLRQWRQPGRPTIPNVQTRDACIIACERSGNVDYSTESVLEEGRLVNNLFLENKFNTRLCIDENGVDNMQALFTKPYRIVHLSGYSTYYGEASDSFGILIGRNVALTISNFLQMEDKPEFVFFNVENTSRTDAAEKLLEAGVKAVIIVVGFVDNPQRMEFSKTFYEHFLTGHSFGNAVLQARRSLYTKYPASNAWSMYRCYGDPFYRLESPGNELANDAIAEVQNTVENKSTSLNLPAARIEVDFDGTHSKASGFFIEGGAFHKDIAGEIVFITCHHVLMTDQPRSDTVSLSVFWESLYDENISYSIKPSGFFWSSKELDTLILRFDEEKQKGFRELMHDATSYSLATHVPIDGSKIEIFFPAFGSNNERAILKIPLLDFQYPHLRYKTEPIDGSSGSPVFNERGELIGIHHASSYRQRKADNQQEDFEALGQAIWIGAVVEALQKDRMPARTLKTLLISSLDVKREKKSLESYLVQKNEEIRGKNILFSVPIWQDNFNTSHAYSRTVADAAYKDADIVVIIVDGISPSQNFDKWKRLFYAPSKKRPLFAAFIQGELSSSIKNSLHTTFGRDILLFEYSHFIDLLYPISLQLERKLAEFDKDIDELDPGLWQWVSEYDNLVRTNLPGDELTRQCEKIKMAMSIQLKHIHSPLSILTSPLATGGARLAAITELYEFPDPDYLSWLSYRIDPTEQPFISYQATLALQRFLEVTGLRYHYKLKQALDRGKLLAADARQREPNMTTILEIGMLHDIKKELDYGLHQMGGILASLLNIHKNNDDSPVSE